MAEDEGEVEPMSDTEEEEDEEPAAKARSKKKKKVKKGNWKNIGSTPRSFAIYPCECRWKIRFPKGPCIKYKQVRWVPLPLSDRIAQMALPLLRRLLALWLEFGDKFPPEMRARLLAFLIENYGLTEEFLEQILEEARLAREEAGKKKEKKPKKRGKQRGKKRKKEAKPQKEKPEKVEKPKKEGGLGFKRRKAGKLPFDWPSKMGSKFILTCISYLSQDPDEDFNSRATEYFDVQAMAILEQVCRFMDMPLPDPERPTQYGETLVIMSLNLSDWIAKYVVTPAQEIADDVVEEYLALRGVPPKVKKDKKAKDKKPVVNEENAHKRRGGEDGSIEERAWDELKSPVYVPPKTRVSKKKGGGDTDEDGYVTETDAKEKEDDEGGGGMKGVPRWRSQTLDDVKKEFLEYLNWYDPWAPEFMYLGPKYTPRGIDMYKIRDADSDDIPDDLRVLHWTLIKYGYTDGYSFIPSPVPQYYPSLRPLRPIRLEDLERSGFPKEVIKQNLRFFSPWYIMSVPLKPPASTPVEEGEELLEEGGETEEQFEDKMLKHSAPPDVKDSLWGDCKMKEQLEILAHIFHLAASVPDLTIEHVFELLEEFCDAVECSESDENPSEENKLNIKKRTIILERYYFNFFGKKFRDYNDRTPHYMRVICTRLAYYIQLLYEYTARNLWELQSRPNLPSPVESPPLTPDDPQALQDWDEWIAWLLRVTKTCDEWAGWITETVEEAERKAAKKKGEYIGLDGQVEKLTREEWFSWKEDVEEKVHGYRSTKKLYSKEAAYYAEKAKDILPVKHRPGKRNLRKSSDEEMEVEGEWEDLIGSEEDDGEEYGKGEHASTDAEPETTAGETEYEDLPENP